MRQIFLQLHLLNLVSAPQSAWRDRSKRCAFPALEFACGKLRLRRNRAHGATVVYQSISVTLVARCVLCQFAYV